jgi:HSP20 family molecular chaperone IbpA
MSISRHLFHELRPLFRMLEEPVTRSSAYHGRPLIFNNPVFRQPIVDLTEDGNSYIVEAELPGVKKENLEVRIGDGGRSVTIEGKVKHAPVTSEDGAIQGDDKRNQEERRLADTDCLLEGTTPNEDYRSTFTRTIWLPQAVNGSDVIAKLSDGMLKVTMAKVADPASVVVPVE